MHAHIKFPRKRPPPTFANTHTQRAYSSVFPIQSSRYTKRDGTGMRVLWCTRSKRSSYDHVYYILYCWRRCCLASVARERVVSGWWNHHTQNVHTEWTHYVTAPRLCTSNSHTYHTRTHTLWHIKQFVYAQNGPFWTCTWGQWADTFQVYRVIMYVWCVGWYGDIYRNLPLGHSMLIII